MAFENNPAFSCFIVVLDRSLGLTPTDIIPFQFMPKTITDSKTAMYNDINIVARSSPIKSYAQSQSRQITFTLDFFAAPEVGLGFILPPLIKSRIDALRALTYPIYFGFGIKPPPRCIIRIGSQLSMVGICRQASVLYDQTIPWTLNPLVFAHGASVTLTFEEALNIPLSNAETRIGYLPFSASGNEFGIGGAVSSIAGAIPTGTTTEVASIGGIVSGGSGRGL